LMELSNFNENLRICYFSREIVQDDINVGQLMEKGRIRE
jgi:hypothetical protein